MDFVNESVGGLIPPYNLFAYFVSCSVILNFYFIFFNRFPSYVIRIHVLVEYVGLKPALRLRFNYLFVILSINLVTVAFELIMSEMLTIILSVL